MLLAAVSCLFVPFSAAYLTYIDFRVLVLLFALMAVVAGFMEIKVFDFLAQNLIVHAKNSRSLATILVGLCFFSAMFITNDVAHITFVPFTLLVLGLAGQMRYAVFFIVLETVAANIGSTLTPVGNPQNLYLYSCYHTLPAAFFQVTLPIVFFGGLLLWGLIFLVRKQKITVVTPQENIVVNKKKLICYSLLFVLCLLGVFDVFHYLVVLGLVLCSYLVLDRAILKRPDYGLLLIFVCFFIFAGNLSHIPAVASAIASFLKGRELLTAVVMSQFISNVPVAVMLSGFTGNASALLAGSNIGGLGTLVASLASLISFKIYCKGKGASALKYLECFSLVNFPVLLLLTVFAVYYF